MHKISTVDMSADEIKAVLDQKPGCEVSVTKATEVTAGLSVSYKLGPRWDDVITWSDFKI